MELIVWLQVKSALRLSDLAQFASNIILIGYLIGFLINRRAVFITVFFICELLAYTSAMDSLSDELYYLFFAGVYSTLYQYLLLNKSRLKTVFACGIIVLLNLGAILDATTYPQTETVFYKSYELLAVVVHLYFVSTVIDWKILRRTMGEIFNSITNYMGIDYTVSYFWYNIYIRNKKA
jgi:hypothetical protein